MEDAKRRRMLHALLDLISLEGIYPSLSSGVGIPLQQRVISVLPAGVIATQAQTIPSTVPRDEPLLRRIIGVLLDILLDPRPSIQPIIRGRILPDIISGTSDLAFNPNIMASYDRSIYERALAKIIEEYVLMIMCSLLEPTLTYSTGPPLQSCSPRCPHFCSLIRLNGSSPLSPARSPTFPCDLAG